MSAPQWKPGDVALVQNEYGVWNTAILQVRPGGGRWVYGVSWSDSPAEQRARSLAVIDPDNAEQMEALAHAWVAADYADLDNEEAMTMPALRMRVALRSLVTDPKPDEPQGLGAVVEDAEGDFWVYAGRRALSDGETREWVHGDKVLWYRDIAAVRVLSEGVAR